MVVAAACNATGVAAVTDPGGRLYSHPVGTADIPLHYRLFPACGGMGREEAIVIHPPKLRRISADTVIKRWIAPVDSQSGLTAGWNHLQQAFRKGMAVWHRTFP